METEKPEINLQIQNLKIEKRRKLNVKAIAAKTILATAIAVGGVSISSVSENKTNTPYEPVNTPITSETPENSASPSPQTPEPIKPTPSPTAESKPMQESLIYEEDIEKQYAKMLSEWSPLKLSLPAQILRTRMINSVNEDGFVEFNNILPDVVIQYDKNDGSFIGQVLSSEGITVDYNDKKLSFSNGQLQFDNLLRSRGLSRSDVCNFKMIWTRDEEFSPPNGETVTSAPASCFIDTTKIPQNITP